MIASKESKDIEFKRSVGEWKEMVETVSAFSNTSGGKIIIGQSSSGKTLGVEIGKDTIEDLTNKIVNNTDPQVFPQILVKRVKGKSVIVVEIKESTDKLVLAFGRPFKRVGKSTIRMSKEEYERIILEKHREELRFDNQICKEAKLKNIDKEKVKSFLRKAKTERGLDIKPDLPTKEVLTRVKLIRAGELTNSAVLLFSNHPQDFFIQSGVKCIRFKGLDVTGEMLDFKEIETDLISEVEQVENFIYKNIALRAWIEEAKIERQEKWEYPPKAIREALVNAIAHRDYRSTAKVQVRIFDDRIEFWNPGRLPEGWTVETLRQKHESKPYNPLIARAFFWIKYIEEVGTGTNKIIQWCKEWGLPEPDFEFTGTSLVVTLRKSKLTDEYLKSLDLNERQKKAIDLIKTRGKITNREYVKIFKGDISGDTALNDLRDMVKKGLLTISGKGRNISYKIK